MVLTIVIPGEDTIMASRALTLKPKKRDAKQPSEFTERSASEGVSEDAIAALAYELWQERGCPVGSDQMDWFQAERELKGPTGLIPTASAGQLQTR